MASNFIAYTGPEVVRGDAFDREAHERRIRRPAARIWRAVARQRIKRGGVCRSRAALAGAAEVVETLPPVRGVGVGRGRRPRVFRRGLAVIPAAWVTGPPWPLGGFLPEEGPEPTPASAPLTEGTLNTNWYLVTGSLTASL
ncbi:MAG: hypothetical protein JO034_06410 [Singulisphaera sp.]|nr:hypothetical protein [Singulisphaera sp.]